MPKIAAVQMSMGKDMDQNCEKTLEFVRRAKKADCRMVCFPEGNLTEYLPQYPGLDMADYAIPMDHPYIQAFCDACRKESIIGSFSVTIEEEGKYYPVNIIIDEGGRILMVTRKHHIVRAPHFYEQDYYTPGNEGFPVCETSIGTIGSIVCFDRHFPESFRTLALKGADLIVVPVANVYGEPLEVFQWEIRIPAFQNSCHTLMINRVGHEGGVDYCGESVFADPEGGAVIGDDKEGLVIADLDFARAKEVREEKMYMPLRRPEVFELG